MANIQAKAATITVASNLRLSGAENEMCMLLFVELKIKFVWKLNHL